MFQMCIVKVKLHSCEHDYQHEPPNSGRDKLAKVKYYRRYKSLPESTQRKLTVEPSKNEVFLSTDRRDRDPIDLTQILGKCEVCMSLSTNQGLVVQN